MKKISVCLQPAWGWKPCPASVFLEKPHLDKILAGFMVVLRSAVV